MQPNTQNTVDGKEDFIMDIISPSGVNKTDKTQGRSEFAHESPFFTNVFFFYISFPWGSLHGFTLMKGSPTFDRVSQLE